jgi:hypothetical protein
VNTARPTPLALAAGLVVVFLMTAIALVWLSTLASRASEDRVASRATTQSLCDLLAIYVQPGQPAPTTARGRTILAKMGDEYTRLKCAGAPAADPAASPK